MSKQTRFGQEGDLKVRFEDIKHRMIKTCQLGLNFSSLACKEDDDPIDYQEDEKDIFQNILSKLTGHYFDYKQIDDD